MIIGEEGGTTLKSFLKIVLGNLSREEEEDY